MLCYITSQPIGNDCFALFIYVYILVRAALVLLRQKVGYFDGRAGGAWLFVYIYTCINQWISK